MFEGPLLVLTHSSCQNSVPPGGYLCETVEVVSGNISVISHVVMTATTCQKIPILQPQVKTLFQRLNVMHRQLLVQSWHSEGLIAPLVANPAKIKVSLDDLIPFLLPGVCLTKAGNLVVAVLCLFWLLWTDISSRMNPSAI